MTAWYNEHDPRAAAWLRELIKEGLIAPGVVDERSIEDILPSELASFTQCHFFAGIGVWSYGLRQAGWPDSRRVWTGSCPCQPFSAAGKGAGFADERHLWPAWDWLIEQCEPECIFGEQVASKDAEPWLDLVQADLEGLGYAFGAVAFPSAGVGAPHIRDRTYWVADSHRRQFEGVAELRGLVGNGANARRAKSSRCAAARRNDGLVANTDGEHQRSAGNAAGNGEFGGRGKVVGGDLTGSTRLEGQRGGHTPAIGQREGSVRPVATAGELDRLGDTTSERPADQCIGHGEASERTSQQFGAISGTASRTGLRHTSEGSRDDARGSTGAAGMERRNERPGPTNGRWADADWLHCRDGKWRPVEPGTFPLAHGAPARVGRLRGYGNALNAQAAQTFIEAAIEAGIGVN